MHALLALIFVLFAALPAAAERPRTGWNDLQGISHYFPLSPEERARLVARHQAQRDGTTGGVFVPQPGTSGSGQGTGATCGWAGCAPGAASNGSRGFQSFQSPQICGWAGCRQGGVQTVQPSRTDTCGWAGCRGGGGTALSASAAPADGGFRDRCGWAGCR